VQSLQQLVLAKNKIKRIDPKSFFGLNELRGLQLEDNGLRSLINIGPIPKLRTLLLSFNRISELSEVDHLLPDRAMPLLQELSLKNNPLSRKHLYRSTLIRKLPSLTIIDGREITQEEREKTEAIFAQSEQHFAGSPLYYYDNRVGNAMLGPPGAAAAANAMERVPIKVQSFSISGFSMDASSGASSLGNPAHTSSGFNFPQGGPLAILPLAPTGFGSSMALGHRLSLTHSNALAPSQSSLLINGSSAAAAGKGKVVAKGVAPKPFGESGPSLAITASANSIKGIRNARMPK
jgi:hypothetical protein